VVQALLILNAGMFLLELSPGGQMIASLALWPLGASESLAAPQAIGLHLAVT